SRRNPARKRRKQNNAVRHHTKKVLKGFAAATTRYACLVAKWQCPLHPEESCHASLDCSAGACHHPGNGPHAPRTAIPVKTATHHHSLSARNYAGHHVEADCTEAHGAAGAKHSGRQPRRRRRATR